MSNSWESARKVALITGANKGIGFEITRQLGRAGLTVLLGARNSKLGESSAAILRGEAIDVDTIPLDLSKEETISAAAEWIASRRLDVLVNNAGIFRAVQALTRRVESSMLTFSARWLSPQPCCR
jgi:NAD(P)-dependent dehydrogenase (short-subunit alcohol dehydrogenase family)